MGLLRKNHKYSYSQLSSAYECPYMYYLEKIVHEDGVSNIFAEIGTLYHDVLDKWAKKEIETWDLSSEFAERYDAEVITEAPAVLAKNNYYEKQKQEGIAFFDNFDEFKGFTIISAEEPFEVEIAGRRFVGIIDMILQDNNSGDLIICDHKSKSMKAFREAEDEMYKQQYLYSKYVYEQFGRYPDLLMFHLFKENGEKICRKFDINDYNKTLEWAEEVMNNIETWEEFEWGNCKPQPEDGNPDFFCANICSMRNKCDNGKKKYKPRRKK